MQDDVLDDKVEFLQHTSCDSCGSSDANAEYTDGHFFCFSCHTFTPPQKSGRQDNEVGTGPVADKSEAVRQDLLTGTFEAIQARRLTEETCRKFGYQVAHHRGEPVQVATYRDQSGRPVAQKLRTKDKRFRIIGDAKSATLFGSHLWSKGKILTICEGEIDTMTVSQVQGHKWATVGLPQGAGSAIKAIKANWEYIQKFQSVVLMFDMDEAGQKAAEEAAEVLPVGKAKIARLPMKDPNDLHLANRGNEIITAIHQAREYRPDGIIAGTDLRDVITVDEAASAVTYPYSMLNEILRGIRKQEMITVLAGSGVGKSTFVRELAHHLHINGQRLGLLMLEESVKRSMLGLVGIHIGKNITIDRTLATDEEVLAGFDDLLGEDKPPLYLYDAFGSNEISEIANRIRYYASALSVDFVVLDHISLLVSAAEGDERRLLDQACTVFRTLVQELNIGLIMVSHLSRPSGDRGHEAGASVRLSQTRGSHAIAQLSDACIALEVDPDDPDADLRHLRVLKNRFTGQTGHAGTLVYDRDAGRLMEDVLAELTTDETGDDNDDIAA